MTGSGVVAFESGDGKSVVYQPNAYAESPIMIMSLGSGVARQLVGCSRSRAFDVGVQGIYYVECGPGPDAALHVAGPRSGQDRVLGKLARFAKRYPVAVSPDGDTILYVRSVSSGADLTLIENFH